MASFEKLWKSKREKKRTLRSVALQNLAFRLFCCFFCCRACVRLTVGGKICFHLFLFISVPFFNRKEFETRALSRTHSTAWMSSFSVSIVAHPLLHTSFKRLVIVSFKSRSSGESSFKIATRYAFSLRHLFICLFQFPFDRLESAIWMSLAQVPRHCNEAKKKKRIWEKRSCEVIHRHWASGSWFVDRCRSWNAGNVRCVGPDAFFVVYHYYNYHDDWFLFNFSL